MKKFLNQPVLKKTIFNETLFICAFMAASLFSASPFIHLIIAPFMKLFLAWGFVIAAVVVADNYKRFLNRYYYLLFGFAGLYAITIFMNRNMNFGANIKALLYMIIIFTVVFNYDLAQNRVCVIKRIQAVMATFLVVSFILAVLSFGTYMFSMKGHAMYNEQWVYYGMFENRLWGMYNPSTGSAINTLSILMMLGYWLFFSKKKIAVKIFLVIAMLMHYFCLLLTNSRTALYTLIIGIGALAFLCIRYLRPKDTEGVSIKAAGKQIGFALLCCIIVLATLNPIRSGLSYIPGIVKYVEQSIGLKADKTGKDKIEKEELTRLEELEDRPGGIFTGRTVLWRAGLKTYAESPIFGITRENIPERVEKNLDDDYWLRDLQRGGLHNIFITVLVSSGIVGFIVFMVFMLILVYKILRFMFSSKALKENGAALTAITLIGVQLIMECLEARILYQVSIFYVLFWSMAGFVLYFINKPEDVIENEH